ncbi:unnamed protein product, partial [marine sediment metagenome]
DLKDLHQLQIRTVRFSPPASDKGKSAISRLVK